MIFIFFFQIHFEPLYIDDRGPKLPCNFFDVPGIDPDGSFGKNELEKILKGEIKLDVSVSIKKLTLTLAFKYAYFINKIVTKQVR